VAWLYFDPDLDADVAEGAVVELRGDEAKHAVTVARARVGERLAIGDGAGLVVEGAVLRADRDGLALEVDAVRRVPAPSPRLVLVQALAKGDRDELAVQAAVELGVAGIVPWSAERSVSRWDGAKAEKGRARWAAIAREAAKQSLRAHVPPVEPLAATAELARRAGRIVVLEPTAEARLAALDLAGDEDVLLVVGPEGGVSPRELDRLAEAGATPARLGAEVLRTSTAGPAAVAALNTLLGRW
jgi:16S rRNA (uracil1498-N3)-methyltransferase